MLKNFFDPMERYSYFRYGRMSDLSQNARSPDQQFDSIDRVIKQCHLPWQHLADYRDDGISGRYNHKRAGLQAMLRDIRTGALTPDLILVDNIERFARLEELPHMRQQLYDRHGILILAADTNFSDPHSPQGRVMGAFEALRAREEGRIKALQVLRGKRDAAKLGHWPGGTAPFGYKLLSVLAWKNGVEEVDHRILTPAEETGPILQMLYQKALETAWGQMRLARWLNEHPAVPAHLKPFEPANVGYWLKNEIYYGELVWEKHCTDIVNDTRVMQRNPESDVLHVPNFCEGLVSREVWDEVNRRRAQRGAALRESRAAKAASNGKQIHAPAPGMVVNYPLTGLVRCGHCGRALHLLSSAVYVTRSGDERRYANYVCDGHAAGRCPNGQRVPEKWLRNVVFSKLLERLFPTAE